MAERRAAEATNQVTQLASELHQRDEALRQRDEALRQKAEELRQKDSQLEALQWTTGAALQVRAGLIFIRGSMQLLKWDHPHQAEQYTRRWQHV
jgi:uncharacterized protein (DUF3084 family)